MSSGTVRSVLHQDIQLVQNLIEQCLQLHMNQKEVVETLLSQAKIEPGFTELVWQKLEEENRDFFKAYYLRLMVKYQIIEFNELLKQQLQLMNQIHLTSVALIPTSNGSNITPLHQNSACDTSEHTGPALKPEYMHRPIGSALPNTFTNGGSSFSTSLHSASEMSAQVSRIDASPNILSSWSSNAGLLQGMNGEMIKQEVGYAGNSPCMFGADGVVLEVCPSIADASVHQLQSTSFGSLGQIAQNFSLSDLTAPFSPSSDLLENYLRSPFLETDAGNFLDSCEQEHQGDNKRLDMISEGLSSEEFGSQ